MLHRRLTFLLLAVALVPMPDAGAQRVGDRRAGVPSVTQDTARRPRREVLFVQRAAVSAVSALALGVPLVIIGSRSGSPHMRTAGGMAYLASAAVGAAAVRHSRNCSMGRRLWLSLGGALAGAVGGAFAAANAFDAPRDEPHEAQSRPGLAGAMILIPLGSAAALYNCN